MKSAFKDLTISVIYWTVAISFSVTIRIVGIDFLLQQPLDEPIGMYYLVSIPGAILGGLLFGLIEIFDNKIRLKTAKSFGYVVFSKTMIYIIVFYIVSFFAAWIGSGSLSIAKQYLTADISIGNFVFFSVASLLFHFFKQMNKKFGPGVMLKYLTGKYFNPIEEDRIFMFLDLKSSTTIAEKLSHVRYSQLIQECFAELTNPVLEYKAQIYQYVGDEAVITWEKDDGLNKMNCLRFYYDYIERLEKKREYFLSTYNLFPEFKAGLSLGLVTVAEVGELKTEIAYHGDVLNTAARIQGYCNKFDRQLLASESLVLELDKCTEFIIDLMGEVELRGKEGLSKVYSCEKPAD
jgi:adenylate cyclase